MFWTTTAPWESDSEEVARLGAGTESGRGTSKRGVSPRRERERRRESQERERRDLLRGVKDAMRHSDDREQQEEQPSLMQPLLLQQQQQEEHQQLQHQQQQPLPLPTLSRPTQHSTFQQQQPQQEQRQEQQHQQQQQLLQHSAPEPLTPQRVWDEPLAQPQVRASSLRHPQAMIPNRQPRSSFRDRMTTDAPTDGDFFVRQLCACLLVTVVLIVSVLYYAHLHPEVFEGIGVVVSVFLFIAKLYIALYPPPVLIIAMVISWFLSATWKEYVFKVSTFPIQVIVFLVWGVRSLLAKKMI